MTLRDFVECMDDVGTRTEREAFETFLLEEAAGGNRAAADAIDALCHPEWWAVFFHQCKKLGVC